MLKQSLLDSGSYFVGQHLRRIPRNCGKFGFSKWHSCLETACMTAFVASRIYSLFGDASKVLFNL